MQLHHLLRVSHMSGTVLGESPKSWPCQMPAPFSLSVSQSPCISSGRRGSFCPGQVAMHELKGRCDGLAQG